MLRLWPSMLHGGLFPGCAWLGEVDHRASPRSAAPSGDLLDSLAMLLAEQVKPKDRGAHLVLMVSDGLAAIAPLPWQDKLSDHDELDAYALAHFERRGQPLDGTWARHSRYRCFAALGMAYALPTTWLDRASAIVSEHGLKLRTVLPVSAAVYLNRRTEGRVACTVALLRENTHSTALVYHGAGLVGHDVEPAISAPDQSVKRLLIRLQAHHGEISFVETWQPAAEQCEEAIRACLPNATIRQMPRHAWS